MQSYIWIHHVLQNLLTGNLLYWLLYGMELQKNSQEEEEEEGEMMFSTTLWKLYINRYFGQQLVLIIFTF